MSSRRRRRGSSNSRQNNLRPCRRPRTGRRRLARCNSVRPSGNSARINPRRATGLELLDHFRQRSHGIAQHFDDRRGAASACYRDTRFNRFSIDQANSPSSRAPTMRPLPLRVWNERRTVTRTRAPAGSGPRPGKTSGSWQALRALPHEQLHQLGIRDLGQRRDWSACEAWTLAMPTNVEPGSVPLQTHTRGEICSVLA